MRTGGRDTSGDRIEPPLSTQAAENAESRRLLEGYRALRTGPPRTPAPPQSLTWADFSLLACVGLLTFVGIAFFGLDRAETSLIVGAFWGTALLGGLWRFPASVNLYRIRSLQVVTVLFALLIGYLSLGFALDPPRPVQSYWDWVGARSGVLDRSAALIELVRLMVLASAFTVGLLTGASDRRSELMLRILAGLACVYAVISLTQFVVAPGSVLWLSKSAFQDRLTGTFFSANVAACAFGVMAMVMLSTIDVRLLGLPGRSSKDWMFIIEYAGAAVILACVVLTASRSGAVATILGVIVLLVLSKWRAPSSAAGGRRQWLFYLAAAAFALGLVLAAQVLMNRLSSLEADWNGRRTLFAVHWAAFLKSPLTGYGLGSFTALNKLLVTPSSFGALWYVRAAHNVYLQWLEETGVVGATLMFAIIGMILFEIIRGLARRHAMRSLMRGVLAASAVLLIQGLADFTLQTPGVAILWALLLGLGYGVATGGHSGVERDKQEPVTWVRRASSWAPRTVAAAAQVMALVVLWGLGARAAADGYPLALRSAYAQAASDQLERPFTAAEAAKVETELTRGLRQAPTDATLWLLATKLKADRAEGLATFARSYSASAIDPPLMKWRTAFAAANWDRLTPDVREKVMTEIEAVRGLWGAEPWLRSLAARYQGTAFGAALALTLATPEGATH